MKISLAKILPNPFRNLDLFPLDPESVAKIVVSENRHGFFGGLRARPSPTRPGFYELAFGHTRVEALRQAGRKDVELDVVNIDDDEMIWLMVTENATQSGGKSAAVMNEVSAAISRLAAAVLSSEHLSGIKDRWPGIAQCFQSQKAYDTTRGTLESGEGIGEPLIRTYLGGGDQSNCPRTKQQIIDGLAALKSAGLYTGVIAAVRDQIAAEAVEQERQAEQAEAEAERAKAAAKNAADKKRAEAAAATAKQKKKNAGKASEARDRANRTTETTTKRQPQTYDPRCVPAFGNPEQERAYREAVTETAAARRFISLDQQLPLAKRMIHELRDRKEYRGRLSATTISMYVSDHIQAAIRAQKQIDEQEREALLLQQYQEMFGERFKNFQWSLDSVKTNADKLLAFVEEHPEFADSPKLGGLKPKIDAVIATLKGLEEQLHGKEVEAPNNNKNPRVIEGKIIN